MPRPEYSCFYISRTLPNDFLGFDNWLQPPSALWGMGPNNMKVRGDGSAVLSLLEDEVLFFPSVAHELREFKCTLASNVFTLVVKQRRQSLALGYVGSVQEGQLSPTHSRRLLFMVHPERGCQLAFIHIMSEIKVTDSQWIEVKMTGEFTGPGLITVGYPTLRLLDGGFDRSEFDIPNSLIVFSDPANSTHVVCRDLNLAGVCDALDSVDFNDARFKMWILRDVILCVSLMNEYDQYQKRVVDIMSLPLGTAHRILNVILPYYSSGIVPMNANRIDVTTQEGVSFLKKIEVVPFDTPVETFSYPRVRDMMVQRVI